MLGVFVVERTTAGQDNLLIWHGLQTSSSQQQQQERSDSSPIPAVDLKSPVTHHLNSCVERKLGVIQNRLWLPEEENRKDVDNNIHNTVASSTSHQQSSNSIKDENFGDAFAQKFGCTASSLAHMLSPTAENSDGVLRIGDYAFTYQSFKARNTETNPVGVLNLVLISLNNIPKENLLQYKQVLLDISLCLQHEELLTNYLQLEISRVKHHRQNEVKMKTNVSEELLKSLCEERAVFGGFSLYAQLKSCFNDLFSTGIAEFQLPNVSITLQVHSSGLVSQELSSSKHGPLLPLHSLRLNRSRSLILKGLTQSDENSVVFEFVKVISPSKSIDQLARELGIPISLALRIGKRLEQRLDVIRALPVRSHTKYVVVPIAPDLLFKKSANEQSLYEKFDQKFASLPLIPLLRAIQEESRAEALFDDFPQSKHMMMLNALTWLLQKNLIQRVTTYYFLCLNTKLKMKRKLSESTSSIDVFESSKRGSKMSFLSSTLQYQVGMQEVCPFSENSASIEDKYDTGSTQQEKLAQDMGEKEQEDDDESDDESVTVLSLDGDDRANNAVNTTDNTISFGTNLFRHAIEGNCFDNIEATCKQGGIQSGFHGTTEDGDGMTSAQVPCSLSFGVGLQRDDYSSQFPAMQTPFSCLGEILSHVRRKRPGAKDYILELPQKGAKLTDDDKDELEEEEEDEESVVVVVQQHVSFTMPSASLLLSLFTRDEQKVLALCNGLESTPLFYSFCYLIPHFNGEVSAEEILWKERISRSYLNRVADAFKNAIIAIECNGDT
eukprot:m.136511 g.136511  ORF g.136511 m.136511 type:complete len:780 (+) comp10718_c0_seq1:166-2505(+)